jgi:hypothetical protein
MAKLVNRLPVEVNAASPQDGHIPIYDASTRLWYTTSTSSLIAQSVQLDQISGSVFANRTYTFPQGLNVSGSLTASNFRVLNTASTEYLGVGTSLPEYPLDVVRTGSNGIYAVFGDDPLSGVTIWDGNYQANHPLDSKFPFLDSSLFSIVNQKPYGNVTDDEYYQFVNYLDLTNYTANDNENVYAMMNFIAYDSAYSQSAAIYGFANSQENTGGYVSSFFTNYNVTRAQGSTATIQNATSILGWIQSAFSSSINTSYAIRAQVDATQGSVINTHYQFYGNTNVDSYGVIQNLYGLYLDVSATSDSASIQNYVGIALDNPTISPTNLTYLLLGTSTIPSGNFAIYDSSSYDSYFNNNIGIGVTPTSSFKLSVNGAISASTFVGYGTDLLGVIKTVQDLQTISGSLTITGSLSVLDTTKLQQVLEKASIISGSTPATINYDLLTQAVVYRNSDATQNWTINFRGDATTSLNDVMVVGQSLTSVILITNGTSGYYATAHEIDGISVIPKWQGSTAPSEGAPNSIEAYSYSIIKTGNATFTVLASKTSFA